MQFSVVLYIQRDQQSNVITLKFYVIEIIRAYMQEQRLYQIDRCMYRVDDVNIQTLNRTQQID